MQQHRSPESPDSHRPPFDAAAARHFREALGMAHGHVAYGIQASYGLPVTAAHIAAWEAGTLTPGPSELTALAGALWCSPSDLMGVANTLRDHRLTHGMAPEDVARRIGMDLSAYQKAEETGRWRGNDRQSTALAEVLALPLPAFVQVTGRGDDVAELLRSAMTTRWQAYVKPVAKLVPLPRPRIESVLQEMHADYQSRMVATSSWGGGTGDAESGDAGRAFLAEVLERFWETLRF